MTRMLRDRRGVAAVEAGIVLALFITPLLSVMVGAGQGMLLQYRVDRALHTGLIYASWATGSTATKPLVETAAQNGYGTAPPTMTATATYSCYCIPNTGTRSGVASTACSTTCGTGTVLARYVALTTADTYTPIFTMNWGSAAWTISATGTIRVPVS